MEFIETYPIIFLSLFCFLANIPLGYLRENTAKFSSKWFIYIHLSIPFIIYFRITLAAPGWFIPVGIFLAIAGQITGARLRKKKMTQADYESIQQIPVLENRIKKVLNNETEIAVVLLNMGGPNTNEDVPDFQHHLFNDRRLIRFPGPALLQTVFAWLLIKFRTKAVKERYKLIGGGSPIYKSTRAQVQALSDELKKRGHNLFVTFSFNYSAPFPKDTINEIKNLGKKILLPVSLYPHYSNATTGSNMFYLRKAAEKEVSIEILEPPSYYLHEGYIEGFIDRIHECLKPGESLDDFYLIFSAHGLPLYSLNEGDPYAFQINQTVTLIVSKLSRKDNWIIAYQSAVGPLEWLKPSTEEVIIALARQGIKKILIVPVAFVGDHIETSCEIDIEYRHTAVKHGIEDYRMSKALETHPQFIAALADSVESYLSLRKVPPQRISSPELSKI